MSTLAPVRLKPRIATVPKLWPGGTVVCLATGPSLTKTDIEYVRGKVQGVIAINDAYKWALWADVLYGCDAKWWRWQKGARAFAGLKYTLQKEATQFPGVQLLRQTGPDGLELDPTGVRTGRNSGYQAINLAVHLGAARIVLLGYDMHGDHCFGRHPDGSRPPFGLCRPKFKTLVAPLKAAGVSIVNCTRVTALDAFPRMTLEQALPAVEEAVSA